MEELIELERLPALPAANQICYRPDRRGLAGVLPLDNGFQVARLSIEGCLRDPRLAFVFTETMAYNATGKLGYVGGTSDKKYSLYIEGVAQGEPWDDLSSDFIWSADGGGYALVGRKRDQTMVETQAALWDILGDLLEHPLAVNRDATKVAWVSTQRPGVAQLFVNGELVHQASSYIGNIVWSPDGNRLAYISIETGGFMVHVGDKVYGPYLNMTKGFPIWSADSQRCAWIYRQGKRNMLTCDGVETVLPVGTVQEGTTAFSADGKHWAVEGRTGFMGLKGCVVRDGELGPTYTALGTTPPVWNAAATALAYLAMGLRDKWIVCDGRDGARYQGFVDGSLTWHPHEAIVGGIAKGPKGPCIAVETCQGESKVVSPSSGFLMGSDRVAFDTGRQLHDLVLQQDGVVCLWTKDF